MEFYKEAETVRDILIGVMIVLSALIIIVVALQPAKTQSASNAFIGGGKEQTTQVKPRGFEAFLHKTTQFLGVLFFIVSIWIAMIS